RAGASVVGADISRYMIALGKSTWPHLELHQADLADLFMLADESFDCVHSAQSAEHWPPERVPTILGELHRVLKPGGLFWCCLDTIELFARQGRLGDEAALKEDPTHICVRPMAWWDEQRDKAGFEDARGEVLPALADHPLSFFERYDWDWFCWRKP
ncbi:MAG: class I SAM-dependent methyltransferase, partial [Pirellulales bacterium]